MTIADRALVLSGGGRVGAVWMLGILDALRQGGVDVGEVDLIVGTSAGAIAGEALLTGGLERALGLHRAGALPRLPAPATTSELLAAMMHAVSGDQDADERVRRMANLPPVGPALVPEADLRSWFAAHLSTAAWPDKRLLVTAVDSQSGERAVFQASSGVQLIDAVMASCAVPGVFPLVEIEGRRYADGGLRSPYNTDLAAGSSLVVLISPLPHALQRPETLEAEIASLRGATVHTVFADDASLAAMGPDLMAEETVVATIDAATAQATRELDALSSIWLAGA